MKRILYIMCAAVAAAAMSSCVDREQGKIDFTTDISDFTIGPEGGIRRISITGDPDDSWSAVTGNEWILVSPATGKGSAVCSVKVDTTVLDQARTGKIDFTVDGKIKTLNITQDGFVKEITLALIGLWMLKSWRNSIPAKWYGKTTTALLYALMFIVLIFPGISDQVLGWMIIPPIAFIILSFIFYLKEIKKHKN